MNSFVQCHQHTPEGIHSAFFEAGVPARRKMVLTHFKAKDGIGMSEFLWWGI